MRATLTLPHGADADALAGALAGLPVALRRAPLHADAARPVLMAMQAPGRAAYLFHDLGPADRADIAATVAAYLAAADGWIIDARPCGRLRLCLKSRIPHG